jgi:hypothetical protein
MGVWQDDSSAGLANGRPSPPRNGIANAATLPMCARACNSHSLQLSVVVSERRSRLLFSTRKLFPCSFWEKEGSIYSFPLYLRKGERSWFGTCIHFGCSAGRRMLAAGGEQGCEESDISSEEGGSGQHPQLRNTYTHIPAGLNLGLTREQWVCTCARPVPPADVYGSSVS